MDQPVDTLARFRRWAAIAVGIAVLGYVGYAMFRGFTATAHELVTFRWSFYLPVLVLTLVNYGLRYAKWAWLLDRLGVPVPHRANLWIFLGGLAMVISPGKAGELLKPYLVHEIRGTPMERTVPVLVAERGTDALAVLILAAVGASAYAKDSSRMLVLTGVFSVGMLGIVASKTLSLGMIGIVRRVGFGGIATRLEAAYTDLRACLAPFPFFVLMAVSLVAWFAECIGYWLIFKGLGVNSAIGACTFLYASATIFGGPSPGGLGMADAALGEGALALIPGVTDGQAVAAALLVRVATLWFGVLLGAVALVRMESVIQTYRTRVLGPAPSGTTESASS